MLSHSKRARSNARLAFLEVLESRTLFAASPLVPSITADTLPAAVVAGAKTSATVKVSVSNPGSTATSGRGSISIFASEETSLDNSASLIVKVPESLAIRAGKSKVFTIKLGSVPNLSDGSYYLIAEVTDSQGNLSSVTSSQTTTIAAPFVSISGKFLPLTSTSPDAGATIVLTNNGNESANLLQLSYDENLATDPEGLDTVGTTIAGFFLNIGSKLKPGASFKLKLSYYKEISAPPGEYYEAFQLVGLGGTTLFTAASATQVTVT